MTGTLLAVAGGVIHGSFALPMKRLERHWSWENIWLVYSVAGLLCLPLLLALCTVPSLAEVYFEAPASLLLQVAVYGACWGIGSTLFGLGISRIGMALGFAIILGITSSFGSLLPLLILHPEQLGAPRGRALILGLMIVLVGIMICARAGALRDRDRQPGTGAGLRGAFAAGFLICLVSGVLSPMLNFGFVFGKPLQDSAVVHGASGAWAANAIWVPGLAGGFLINGGYAVYRLCRNRTWAKFTAPGAGTLYWLGAALMGALWFGGMSIYGMGAATMGELGGVIAWPVFMSTVIVTANVNGLLSGEWKGAKSTTLGLSWLGLALLVVAIVVVSRAA
jgi:L-rhamnose-H+ transport protein